MHATKIIFPDSLRGLINYHVYCMSSVNGHPPKITLLLFFFSNNTKTEPNTNYIAFMNRFISGVELNILFNILRRCWWHKKTKQNIFFVKIWHRPLFLEGVNIVLYDLLYLSTAIWNIERKMSRYLSKRDLDWNFCPIVTVNVCTKKICNIGFGTLIQVKTVVDRGATCNPCKRALHGGGVRCGGHQMWLSLCWPILRFDHMHTHQVVKHALG